MKRKSFSIYYNECFEKIYRYVFFRSGRDKSLTEDLTSEIMLKAYEDFKNFDQKKSFPAWIYRIAHNHLIDFYKKLKGEKVPLEKVENKLPDNDNFLGVLNDRINIGKIEEVLDKMPPKQRDVIVMRFMNEFSSKEIAHALDLTEAHVRILQHRAMQFLRSRLNFLEI